VLPFEEAVLKAANDLFTKAQLPAAGSASPVKHAVVIDPLVDGLTGVQSTATQSMQSRIEQVVRDKYPQFEVQPFSASNVATSPIVLVGTFTGVNKEGKSEGTREAYRICLALADLKSGKIVGKARTFAQMQGVDATPMRYFQDSPVWMQDPTTEAYIKTCQATKVGDPVDPIYVDRIIAAALISEAMDAYNAGQYRESLDLYTSALQTTGGDQLRVYNGVYLSNWKLGQRDAAAQAFGKIVDYGLTNKRLAVKFLFKPGSTSFWPDPEVSGPYGSWLEQIAARTSQRNACLEITGHTSRTGSEPLNERLSLLRAEYIKQRLEFDAPELGKRTIANGKGSRENMVGTGRDDATDAIDRRVEFKVLDC
jgi:outer membrane protein OmpA-like peptidoglycan-associated protein